MIVKDQFKPVSSKPKINYFFCNSNEVHDFSLKHLTFHYTRVYFQVFSCATMSSEDVERDALLIMHNSCTV